MTEKCLYHINFDYLCFETFSVEGKNAYTPLMKVCASYYLLDVWKELNLLAVLRPMLEKLNVSLN